MNWDSNASNASGPGLRLMLVDDHAVVRQGCRRLLESEPGLQVVAECADAGAAFATLDALAGGVDVVVLDLSMPGRSGLDVLRRLGVRWPGIRTLVFSMHASVAMVQQAFRAGAAGFVTKNSDPESLITAVKQVMVSSGVLSEDLQGLDFDLAAAEAPPHLSFSTREFDVFRFLAQGLTAEDIATRLHVSAKTVFNYQSQIRQKLGVSSAHELLRYAQLHGLDCGAPPR